MSKRKQEQAWREGFLAGVLATWTGLALAAISERRKAARKAATDGR